MAKHNTIEELFSSLANSIRSKTKKSGTIIADDFPDEISNMVVGFDYINDTVTTIPDYAFDGCTELNNVRAVNVTSIGANAFENCVNLEKVILYIDTVTVGTDCFKGCTNLTIYCEASEKPETWDENWNPDNRPVVWGYEELVETWDVSASSNDNVTATVYSRGKSYLIDISGSGDMESYSTLASNVPWYTKYSPYISMLRIGAGITSIGSMCFYGCENLTSVTIPSSVTSIGSSAFSYCKGLESVTIPSSVTSIGPSAFSHCKSLTSITIPSSVTSIGRSAFWECTNLTSINIPEGVTTIYSSTFKECRNLISITIPNGVTTIENSAFYYCNDLASITIPSSVTSIGDWAFHNCYSLTSINIPNGVTSIGDWAFAGCSDLTSIYIPDSVVSIDYNAFINCTNLTIYCEAPEKPEGWDENWNPSNRPVVWGAELPVI